MSEEHFYADVDLPFHVWVRESSGAPGFRWVLREAPHRQSEQESAPVSRRDPPPTSPDCA